MYPTSATLISFIKEQQINYRRVVKKNMEIFLLNEKQFVKLFLQSKPSRKKGYYYVVLPNKKTLRIAESLYKQVSYDVEL